MDSREFYQKTNALEAIVRENFRFLVLAAVAFVGAAELGIVEYPSVPAGSGVLVTGAVVAAGAGFVAASKIDKLLPDPPGIYIVEFRASDDTGGAVYEITEDQFEAMEVVNGSLFQWPETGARVYEVKEYRPQENIAVANWRESVAGSQLAGDARVPEAFASIDELRSEFEPEARKFRLLQRRIRKVTRRLDRRRLKDQEALLDEHTTPSFDSEDATVSGVLQEELPDELLPDSMRAGEADSNSNSDGGEDFGEAFEAVVDFDSDGEAIEPTTNGGQNNE